MTITAPVDGDPLDPAWAASITEAVNNLTTAWGSYTPVWSSSGTQPAIVNGTIVGQWERHGNDVTAWATITIGSGTTFGTGSYRLSLPTPAFTTPNGPGVVWMFDSGTASRTGATYWVDASTMWLSAASGGDITPTNPQTFAVGDIISAQATYRIA